MKESRYDRRTVIKTALMGAVVLPGSGLLRTAAANGAPRVDEKDPVSVAMGYVHDASSVDPAKVPQFKPGSDCANCLQIAGNPEDEWRPCNIFPGKLVNAKGWCKVWIPKPGA